MSDVVKSLSTRLTTAADKPVASPTREEAEAAVRTLLRWAGDDDGEAVIEHLRGCLDRLTPRARQALEMRFRGEHSRAEIAAALEITEHGAKNLMQRAKQQLRECIESKLNP